MHTWRNLPLRVRLTLLNVGLWANLLCLLGSLLYWDTHRFLLENTALRLRAQAKPIIAQRLYAQPPAADEQRLHQVAADLARDLTSRDTAALVLDQDGNLLATGQHLAEEPTPLPPDPTYDARALAGENEVTYLVTSQGHQVLVLLIPLRDTPGGDKILGLVQLSTTMTSAERLLSRQKWLIGLGSAAVLLLGTVLGLWLTTSSLQDLTRMVTTCRLIAGGDFSKRVNLPHHDDEVGQLAQAFDEMAARIEATFASQRRFVANAAHELRTPLTALQGSLEVLMRGAQDDPASVARLTQGMYREVTRLSRLCEQLLDLSHMEAAPNLHLQPIDLSQFIVTFLPQAQLLAQEHTLTLESSPPATVQADPDALTQILFNLIANAVQHTDAGTTITLGWQTRPTEVSFYIRDNGGGISADDLPHIFEPFYRGDNSRSRRRGGTGLGLTLTRALIEAQGGHIAVQSHVGQGTTFTFTLPLAESTSKTLARS